MANLILFRSSIICTIIHIGALWYYPGVPSFYCYTLIRGTLLSIYNHGSTCIYAQQLDRWAMIKTFFINLAYINQTNTWMIAGPLMVLAVLLYMVSKCKWVSYGSSMIHAIAHMIITITHLIIIASFD